MCQSSNFYWLAFVPFCTSCNFVLCGTMTFFTKLKMYTSIKLIKKYGMQWDYCFIFDIHVIVRMQNAPVI